MFRKHFFIVMLGLVQPCKATFFPSAMGPYALGVGGITASKNDPYAAFNHPAFIAFLPSKSVSMAIQSNYFIDGLNYMGVVGNYPLKKYGVLGIGCGSIGNKYYNESLIKLGWSKKMNPKLGLAISTDYFRLQIPENQKKVIHKLLIEVGAYYQFNQRIYFAVKLFNPFRTQIAEYQNERLPFLIHTSCFFDFNEHLALAAEWEQKMSSLGMARIGLEYVWKEKTRWSAGMFGKPLNPGFGITLERNKMVFQFSCVYHPYLGVNSGLGITSKHLSHRLE